MDKTPEQWFSEWRAILAKWYGITPNDTDICSPADVVSRHALVSDPGDVAHELGEDCNLDRIDSYPHAHLPLRIVREGREQDD